MQQVATKPRYTTLTSKQERFCLNISEGMSQREAYVQAGYSRNALPNTLDRSAYDLYNLPKIIARREVLRQKAEDASVAGVLERKQILTEIVRGRFADFMVDGAKNPEKLKSAAIQEIRTTTTGITRTTTIKLHDPTKAIDLLNKMDGIYQDGAVHVDARSINVNIQVTSEAARDMTQAVIDGKGTD